MPGANKTSTDLVNDWAAKEKVEVQIDYITSQGNKLLLTIAAEGQAKSGHDILAMATWWPHTNAEMLESVNDIMDPIIKQNGDVNDTAKYLGQANGKWLGVPACIGNKSMLAYRPERSTPTSRAGDVSGVQPAGC